MTFDKTFREFKIHILIMRNISHTETLHAKLAKDLVSFGRAHTPSLMYVDPRRSKSFRSTTGGGSAAPARRNSRAVSSTAVAAWNVRLRQGRCGPTGGFPTRAAVWSTV